jgi:predicted ATPase
MLSRLQGQALLSTEEARDVPGRHHALRDAIDWSYGLLSITEQAAFRRLGVFVGGMDPGGGGGYPPERRAGLAHVGRPRPARGQSLMQPDALGGDDRRYRFLQPVREFALARLQESGELDPARERHAQHFLALAEQAAAAGWGPGKRPGSGGWRRSTRTSGWPFGGGRSGETVSSACASPWRLADFWAVRGHLREGRRWLEEARALGTDAPPRLRAKALAGEGTRRCAPPHAAQRPRAGRPAARR